MDSSAVTFNLKVAKLRASIHVEDEVPDFERLRLNNICVLDFFVVILRTRSCHECCLLFCVMCFIVLYCTVLYCISCLAL